MRARAPASSANLGPGFDTLAVALALYVEVDVREADAFSLESTGEGADLPRTSEHLAARVVNEVTGHNRWHITVRSQIPVSRGLGSSAALAVAAAAAVGAPDPLAVAARLDGHPENAAASVLGGFVTAAMTDGTPVAAGLPLDTRLGFVVLVPDRLLATKEARGALPKQVAHADASFNLGRMGMLIAGLADSRLLVAAAMGDRLHQPHRARLFPEADALITGLLDAGARAACWSGAGPALLAVCDRIRAGGVREAGEELLRRNGVAGRALVVDADLDGVAVEE